MRSIRRDLTMRVVSRVLPLIALGSLVVYIAVRHVVLREFDSALRREMQVLATAAERVGTGVDFDYGPEKDTGNAFDEGLDYYFQATLSDGSLLKESPALNGRVLSMHEGQPGEVRIGPVTLPSGREGRGCVYVFEPRPESPDEHNAYVDRPDAPPGPVRIIIAATTGDIDRPLAALAVTEMLVGVVLLGAAVLALHRSVRTGLAPVNDLARQVTGIGADNLAARVDESTQPSELTPITSRLNELLARVEEAFVREKRFTANAAHELRTPIAEIRTIAEVALGARDERERTQGLAEIACVCQEMEGTISALLMVARAKSGTLNVQRCTVDLSALLTESCSKHRPGRMVQSPTISCCIPPGLSVETDPAVLSSVVHNLLENALAYTPEGGVIKANAQPSESGVRLTIENTCTGLVDSDLREMFDPFWRKRGTSVEGRHSGLGLALVKALCDAIGASVCAQLITPQTLAVRVQFSSTGQP